MSFLSKRTRKGLAEAILLPVGMGVVIIILLAANSWVGSVA